MTFFDGPGPVLALCFLALVFLAGATAWVCLWTREQGWEPEHDTLDALKELP